MVVAEVCSSMKYPKRCQYKHAKQKKYHVRNWAEYNEGLRRRVLPPLSVGEMTLRLYGALNYSQNSVRDLRCTLNGA